MLEGMWWYKMQSTTWGYVTGAAILKSNWAAVVKFNVSTLKMKVPIEKGSPGG